MFTLILLNNQIKVIGVTLEAVGFPVFVVSNYGIIFSVTVTINNYATRGVVCWCGKTTRNYVVQRIFIEINRMAPRITGTTISHHNLLTIKYENKDLNHLVILQVSIKYNLIESGHKSYLILFSKFFI
jgi:hypothetical protein